MTAMMMPTPARHPITIPMIVPILSVVLASLDNDDDDDDEQDREVVRVFLSSKFTHT